MGTLIMVGQLLLGLSIIVGLHELGHLVTAKVFGMRVEKYSIGFPPKIFGFNWGETEYSLGALPLGGFVKISGMIDESFDTDYLDKEPEAWEFRSKPAWQRLIVMLGGIIVNVITGIMMFIGITYYWGEDYLPAQKATENGIVAYELGKEIGLKTGDKIIKVNGKSFDKFNEILSSSTLLESNSYYTVLRNGKELDIPLPNDLVERLSDKKNKNKGFIYVRIPLVVDQVKKGTPAARAKLQEGDQVIGFNGKPIKFFDEFGEAKKGMEGKKVSIRILRDDQEIDLDTKIGKDGMFGFSPKNIKYTHLSYTIGESVALGTQRAFGSVVNNIKGFGKIFRGEVSLKSVSGPIGIVKAFSPTWDWPRFWFIVAVLSMWLAFLNFLPIPALDGGHVMFITYEIISGKKPSDKFLEKAQYVGVAILLTLMVFVIGNDIVNFFI